MTLPQICLVLLTTASAALTAHLGGAWYARRLDAIRDRAPIPGLPLAFEQSAAITAALVALCFVVLS